MKKVVFQCGPPVSQRHQNRGAGNCKSRIMSFTEARMTSWSAKVPEHHDLCREIKWAKRFTTTEDHPWGHCVFLIQEAKSFFSSSKTLVSGQLGKSAQVRMANNNYLEQSVQ